MTPRLWPLYILAGATLGAWGGYAAKGGDDSDPAESMAILESSGVAQLHGRSVTPATEAPSASVAAQPPRQSLGVIAVEAGNESGAVPSASPPRAHETGGLLSQLDAIEIRIKALAERDPSPALCESACLSGVQSVQLRRGVVSCRCRHVASLGVYRMPEARR